MAKCQKCSCQAEPNSTRCKSCKNGHRQDMAVLRQARRDAGLCYHCGENEPEEHGKMCTVCKKKVLAWGAKRRAAMACIALSVMRCGTAPTGDVVVTELHAPPPNPPPAMISPDNCSFKLNVSKISEQLKFDLMVGVMSWRAVAPGCVVEFSQDSGVPVVEDPNFADYVASYPDQLHEGTIATTRLGWYADNPTHWAVYELRFAVGAGKAARHELGHCLLGFAEEADEAGHLEAGLMAPEGDFPYIDHETIETVCAGVPCGRKTDS